MTAQQSETRETAGKGFVADTLISLLGTAGGQLVTVAAIPILARLYSPEHFGVWALYMAALAVLPVLATLRLDIAIVAAKSGRVAQDVGALSILLSISMGILLTLLVLLIAALPAGQSWFRVHLTWLVWLPLGVAAAAIYSVGLSWWLRRRAYRAITFARIGFALSAAVLQVALTGTPDGIGLILGYMGGQTLTALAVLAAMAPELRAAMSRHKPHLRLMAALKRFRGLALYTTPYSLQQQIFRHAIVVLLTVFSSVETSGLFAMAQRCVLNPLTLIAAAVEQSVYPRIARTPSDPAIHQLVATTMRWLAVLLGAGSAFLTVFAEPLVLFVLGAKWLPAAPYLAATSYAAATLVASSWLVRVFDIFGRQKLHLVFDLTGNLLILAACILTLWLTGSALWGVIALCAGMAIYYGAWTVLAFHVAHMPSKPLVLIVLAGVVAWALVFAASVFAKHLIAASV